MNRMNGVSTSESLVAQKPNKNLIKVFVASKEALL
jgi:hypothetical protein